MNLSNGFFDKDTGPDLESQNNASAPIAHLLNSDEDSFAYRKQIRENTAKLMKTEQGRIWLYEHILAKISQSTMSCQEKNDMILEQMDFLTDAVDFFFSPESKNTFREGFENYLENKTL